MLFVSCLFVFFFLFKQKTAYEVRISDWSSDVCSSDLPLRVSERSASQTLKQWDRIGARVVQVGGKHLLSGGVLSFTMEAAEALVADLRRSKGKRSPRTALNLDADDLAALPAL